MDPTGRTPTPEWLTKLNEYATRVENKKIKNESELEGLPINEIFAGLKKSFEMGGMKKFSPEQLRKIRENLKLISNDKELYFKKTKNIFSEFASKVGNWMRYSSDGAGGNGDLGYFKTTAELMKEFTPIIDKHLSVEPKKTNGKSSAKSEKPLQEAPEASRDSIPESFKLNRPTPPPKPDAHPDVTAMLKKFEPRSDTADRELDDDMSQDGQDAEPSQVSSSSPSEPTSGSIKDSYDSDSDEEYPDTFEDAAEVPGGANLDKGKNPVSDPATQSTGTPKQESRDEAPHEIAPKTITDHDEDVDPMNDVDIPSKAAIEAAQPQKPASTPASAPAPAPTPMPASAQAAKAKTPEELAKADMLQKVFNICGGGSSVGGMQAWGVQQLFSVLFRTSTVKSFEKVEVSGKEKADPNFKGRYVLKLDKELKGQHEWAPGSAILQKEVTLDFIDNGKEKIIKLKGGLVYTALYVDNRLTQITFGEKNLVLSMSTWAKDYSLTFPLTKAMGFLNGLDLK